MTYKDPNKDKEYNKAYYQANKDKIKEQGKAYYQAHKEARKATMKAWRDSNKEHYRDYQKEYKKAWYAQHKEQVKAWQEAHKEYYKAYKKSDLNANGETKHSIRMKSLQYLNKYGSKIPGYQIHHCSGYTEPYKFIYCSREMHKLIHSYLRQHNIDADSNHYEQIKHLLDDSVVLYGIE